MIRLIMRIFFTCALFFIFIGSGDAAERIPVFVSIVPQKFFVQQIGKDLVSVQVMVQPGASPATYEPKPKQMAALSKAAIYFSIGVPFENAWLSKFSAANPGMTVVATDHDIKKLPMATHHHDEEHGNHEAAGPHHEADHDHDKDAHHSEEEPGEDHHAHGALDPHVWLSPPLVKIQAHSIMTALQTIDPAHGSIYAENYRHFASTIDELDTQLKQTFAGRQGLQFMVFHPAWGYFAHAYGLQQVPIEIEGKDPKPAQLQRLIEHARESKINVIFVQPQFSTKSAGQIAEAIHGQVLPADPLAEDWTGNLRMVAEKFKAALR
ncbi:cation ABC transporter substrate-binding protein [Desulfosarcina ovata subsp. sediminis]|uniref:Cation ABC transporter substrate-binding protein n=1 Tax=Desulfosarcina ovata subsp. sediminis TaxID=885957 RepID=A0A5K7ZTW5_9BACT|nr:zinc ABC transporter substrate-binding protein [Desulfosarcina ovata]BBO83657.1 cation ABC transporter substrate-binding protein [Desulfosarcina ovata subsp. sediminis]